MVWCQNCTKNCESSFCCEECKICYNFYYKRESTSGIKKVKGKLPKNLVLSVFGGILSIEEYHSIPDNVTYEVLDNPRFISEISKVEISNPKTFNNENKKRIGESQKRLQNTKIPCSKSVIDFLNHRH